MENDPEGREPDTVSDEWNTSEHPVVVLVPVRDDAGTIVDLAYSFVNDAALRLNGMSREDVLGRGLLELFPSSLESGVFDADMQAIRTQQRVDTLVPWVDEHGVRGAFAQQAVPHRDGVLITAIDVTPKMLAESNERYRMIAEASRDVVFTRGSDGAVTWVSPSVTRILGWRREDVVGRSVRDLIHPDDLTTGESSPDTATDDDAEAARTNIRFATADGDWRLMSATQSVISDDEGSGIGAVESLRDIQSEVEAREELERSVSDLRSAQRMAGLASWKWDPSTDQVTWSVEQFEMFGLDPAGPPPDFGQQTKMYGPQSLVELRAAVAEATRAAVPYDLELEFFRADSSRGWMRSWGEPVVDEHGVMVELRGYSQDITEQVEARRAVERSDQMLRATQRMARLGSWEWDIATDHATWSDEMFELFGTTPEPVVPDFANQAELYTTESWERLVAAVGEASATGATYEMELEIVRADSSHGWVRVQGVVVRDERGDIVGQRGYVLDISDEVEARRALERSAQDLIEAQQLARLGSWKLDVATQQIASSAEVRKMLGLDPALVQSDFGGHTEMIEAESLARLRNATAETISTGVPFELEIEFSRSDSGRGWMRTRGQAVRDDHGVVVEVHGYAQDITEQVEARRALERRSRDLSEVQQLARLGSWKLDVATQQVTSSPELRKMFGWDDDVNVPDFEGHAAMLTPESVARLNEALEDTVRTGESYELELGFVRADSSRGWMRSRGLVVVDDHGVVVEVRGYSQDITEQVEARRALERSAQDLREAQRLARLGNWKLDVATQEVTWSAEVREMFGWDAAGDVPNFDEHMGVLESESLARLEGAVAETVRTGGSYELELELVRADSGRGWMRTRGQAVRDDHGVVVEVHGYAQDITEQVEARRALERSDQMLRATQRMARLGSWEWDIATDHVVWSHEMFELFGLERSSTPPNFVEQAELYEAESWETLGRAVTETARTGVPYLLELQIVRGDCKLGWAQVRGEAVRDDNGVIVGLRGFVLDITERKEVERALASSEALFRTAMLDSPIGMAMSDLDGSFRVVNESLCELLGRNERWFENHTIKDVVHPDDLDRLDQDRAAVIEGDESAELETIRLVRSDNRVLRVKRVAELIEDAAGSPDYLLVQYVDTTAEYEALEELAYQASHDPLTGLHNWHRTMHALEADLATTASTANRVAVLFIDLDHFKIVNDSLGHAAGDEVLMTVADRIASVLRPEERVGRAGGDEFIVTVPDLMDVLQAERVAEQIVTTVASEMMIRGHRIVPTVSIGVALSVSDSTSSSLLRDADAALFRAKAAGRSRWKVFDEGMHTQALERLTIEDEIRRGLSDAEFVVHYQPIVTLADRQVAGHEALVRWQHPTRGLLSPIHFLPTAEDSGLIVGIGQVVLDQVCALLAANPDLPGPISINFSPVQLARADWFAAFTDTLTRHGVDPRRIVVEVTETAVMSLLPGTRSDLVALRELGVGIHVDDFGTGFSSISLLRDMPVSGLKLDATFVADLSEDDDDAANALSTGLSGLVRGLDLIGVAEGVELESQDRILLEQGWSHAQGYLYGRPAPQPALTIAARVG